MKHLFALLFFLPVFAHAEAVPGGAITDKTISPAVHAAVETRIAEKKLAGAVTLIAQNGRIIHLETHGKHALGAPRPMAPDTIFRIHSMSKALTSAAALQLLEQGKYKLDDPVSKYIPTFEKLTVFSKTGDPKPAENVMAVEDLFRHTSGLAYAFAGPPELAPQLSSPVLWGGDLENFCDELAKIPLVHEPGTGWTYGTSTDVLGRLVEIWSGKPLDQYLAETIFGSLGMKDTAFFVPEEKRPRFAGIQKTGKNGIKPSGDSPKNRYLQSPKLPSGGGGLVSTADDYFRFLRAIAHGGTWGDATILKPETAALMTSNRLPDAIPQIAFGPEIRTNTGFGLGFSVNIGESKDWDPDAKLREYGWGGAASCHYWISPSDENLIVITLEQTMPYNWNLERTLKPIIYKSLNE